MFWRLMARETARRTFGSARTRILRARDQEVGGELGTEQALLARGGGEAVLGLAVLLNALLDLAARDGSEVDGAGLELVERGVRVLLDGHVHAVEAGLLTVVILKAGQGDVLVVLPGSVIMNGPLPMGCSRNALGSSSAQAGTGARPGWQQTAGKSAMGSVRVTSRVSSSTALRPRTRRCRRR